MSEEISKNTEIAAVVGGMPWWLVLVWGILAVIIGIMLVASPLTTVFYLILFMGAYWFVGGIFTIISLFNNRENMGWKLFLAIISIIAGIAIMTYPIYGSIIVLTLLVFIIGFWALLIGGTKIYEAVRSKDAGSGILGVISIIFGIILLVYPYGAAYALPLVAGIIAIIGGISAIAVSFQIKKSTANN